MPVEVLERYRAAQAELRHRQERVLRLVTVIREACRALEHWECVTIKNSGVGFPTEVSMIGRSIDAATWPAATELAEALSAWHAAREEVHAAWARLSPDERTLVGPLV